MGPRTVIKLADWTIGPDREEGASPPIRQVECTTCGWQSQPSVRQLDTDTQALAHAGRTSHPSYREITTAFLRVVPADGNPKAVTS
ncbi:hypothetical protein [Streptomyces sp. NPDC002889]|uniref:DUF7848 domain-containing protein n=1 Tax=Streptomyces sp. NPDC002889 TaxID=3364669 RepID=UPI0036857AF4